MDIRPGALVDGRFRVLARVGEGGMGTVWSARSENDGRDVALKILKASGDDQLRRLLREARIAQRLEHPNVVSVDEILASSSASPVLVMELLSGESLRERISRIGALTPADAARVVADAAAAAAAAHALGIVHRDLKPENVFIHHDGERTVVKVLDFGIAKLAASGELATGGMTRTGAMLGTPHYMAPEQVFGEGDIDARADVWALGVVLFECLTGQRPFDGENAGQVFKAVTMGPIPSLDRAPHVPVEIADLTLRMLARERGERPAIDVVLEVLSSFASAELAAAPRASMRVPADRPSVDPLAATVALDATATPSPIEMARPPTTPLRARRVRGLLATAAVVMVAALAGIGLAPRAKTTSEPIVVGPTATTVSPAPPPASATITLAMLASAEPTGAVTPPPPPHAARTAATARSTARPAAAPPLPTAAPKASAEPDREHAATAPAQLPGGVHGVSPY